jgi:hypothetical protein
MPWSYQVAFSNKLLVSPSGAENWQYSQKLSNDWRNVHAICLSCHRARFPTLDFNLGLKRLDGQTVDVLKTAARSSRGLEDGQIVFLFNSTRQNLVWPQLITNLDGLTLAPGDDIWNLLTFEASSRSQTNLVGVGLVRLSNQDAGQTWATTPQAMVWIIPNEAAISQLADASDVRGRVQATILHFNLNYHNGTFYDTRVANRTNVFGIARDTFNALTGIVQSVRGFVTKEEDLEHENVLTLLLAIRETVRATGFWSVWVWVFQVSLFSTDQNNIWNNYSVDARKGILYSLFVEYEVPSDEESVFVEVLPGTDSNRLPF